MTPVGRVFTLDDVRRNDAFATDSTPVKLPAGEALASAQALARKIADKSQVPMKLGKAAFYAQVEMGLDDAYAYASRVMAENMLARDADEGISAVLAKRAAVWEDR